MSPESEYLLLHDVLTRRRSAIPVGVSHVGSEDDAELLATVGGTPAAAPEPGALPIFKPPPGSPRSIVAACGSTAATAPHFLLRNGEALTAAGHRYHHP